MRPVLAFEQNVVAYFVFQFNGRFVFQDLVCVHIDRSIISASENDGNINPASQRKKPTAIIIIKTGLSGSGFTASAIRRTIYDYIYVPTNKTGPSQAPARTQTNIRTPAHKQTNIRTPARTQTNILTPARTQTHADTNKTFTADELHGRNHHGLATVHTNDEDCERHTGC